MNRRERRAAKARSRHAKLDPRVAVHEAGHAVGRFLTAADLGYSTEESISYIDVGLGRLSEQSADGCMRLVSEATTYGPMLSRKIQETVFASRQAAAGLTRQEMSEILANARAAGLDCETWLAARLLMGLMGGAAEAKLLGKTFNEVWQSYECESDMKEAVKDCMLAGIEETKMITTHLNVAAARAIETVQRPDVWRAILALADRLPATGRFDGKEAAATITRALRP
jgi:hypothetical protein